MRLINWRFNDMRNTEMALGNHVFLALGKWDGLLFDVSGLGLTKTERENFGTEFLRMRNIVNLYLGRFIISIDKQGMKEHFRSVQVVKIENVSAALMRVFAGWFEQIKAGYHSYLDRLQFKEKYEFQIDKYYEGTFRFKSDLLTVFRLSSNYEADLIWNGHYILSPLGFSYEENRDLIKKYLGKRFITKDGMFNLGGYARDYDSEIREYKRVA